MNIKQTLHYISQNWNRPDRRPLWQIALLLPLLPAYLLANKFVKWVDSI